MKPSVQKDLQNFLRMLQNPSLILVMSDNSYWTDLAYGHPAIQLGHPNGHYVAFLSQWKQLWGTWVAHPRHPLCGG